LAASQSWASSERAGVSLAGLSLERGGMCGISGEEKKEFGVFIFPRL
jgi:hypothetical protein